MQLWITSDQHFGHKNMAEVFTKADGTPARPFGSVSLMDSAMIARWNDTVKPQDHVWCLGDVAMNRPALLRIVPLLHGHKRLVRGNHDIYKTKDYLAAGFEEIRGVSVRNRIVYTHIPIHPMSMARFLANVHGHTHDAPDYDDKYLNVCVERTDYTPVAVETIEQEIARRHRKSVSITFTPHGMVCPTCKSELRRTNSNVIYTTNPPMYDVGCDHCGYRGRQKGF